jgi:Flp pilus assembly protein TadD
VVLLLATLVAFWPVLGNGFVSFDDPSYITANERVSSGFGPGSMRWAFSATDAHNWHPLTWLSHMLDVELFGLDPGRHHLVNLVLHGLNAVLLFGVLRLLTGALWPSAAVALLFSVHPLRVESVAWASERKDVLSAFFWLATVGAWTAYARDPSRARYARAFVLFLLGLLSKPMLVTMPFVLLLLDYWPLARAPSSPVSTRSAQAASWRRLVAEKLPFLGLALAVSGVTLWAQRGVVQSVESFPPSVRLANAIVAYVRYLGKLLWPVDLSVFYPYPRLSLTDPVVLGCATLMLVATVLAIRGRRRGYPLIGWLWYVSTLVPVIGLVQVGLQSMADRYTYLPSIGVLWLVVWGWCDVSRGRVLLERAGVAVLAVVSVVCVFATQRQAEVWRDDESLYRHAVQATVDSYWAHYNLGLTLMGQGRAEDALESFTEALRLEPRSVPALKNAGALWEEQGNMQQATELFARARAADPDDVWAARHLTRVLVDSDRLAEADERLEQALFRWPADPELLFRQGLLRVRSGDFEGAVEPLSEAVRAAPGEPVYRNVLGIALGNSGRLAEARASFAEAVRLAPAYREAAANLERLDLALSRR